ncbi:MAG: hypothetical protein HYV95_03970 [Opitutae bacterium]|nr:hypothetical protein [Opitutae bacterium]
MTAGRAAGEQAGPETFGGAETPRLFLHSHPTARVDRKPGEQVGSISLAAERRPAHFTVRD